jgi:glutamate dehydrogenase/leucine dehydrogenase
MNATGLMPPQFELDHPQDPLLTATLELERCARLLDLEDWIVERLRHCEQEVVFNFLLPNDKGESRPATGLWVRHCTATGPAVASFQISRNAYRNSLCANAMRNTWLCALYGLNHGGAAAALIVDSQKHTERELRRAIYAFANASKDFAEKSAFLVPEGVHEVEIEWLAAGLETEKRPRPYLVGKAAANAEDDQVTIGVAELIHCAEGNLKQRVAVQGFDETVQPLIEYLQRHEARVVAVSDASGGVRHDLGLDTQALKEHVQQHGVLLGYPEAEAVLNADVLETECDVLVLAGSERQIGTHNAKKIRAGVLVELAPGAVTEEAEQTLSVGGKLILPNLICADPEMLRAAAAAERGGPGSRSKGWMRRVIREMWRGVSEAAAGWNVSIAEASRALAVQRVAAVLRAQGVPF